jgi:hypothetical protein
MRIAVLALDGVFDLGLSAVLDGFQTANELIELSRLTVPRFQVRIVGVRGRVPTTPDPKGGEDDGPASTPRCRRRLAQNARTSCTIGAQPFRPAVYGVKVPL